MHQPIFKRWIAHGIVTGRLRFKSLATMPKVIVSAPAHPTVDVGRESRANVSEFEAGLKTRSEIWQEQGLNPREEIERMANEAQLAIETAKRRGLPIELVMPPRQTAMAAAGAGRGGQPGGGGGGSDSSAIGGGLDRTVKDLTDRVEELEETKK